MEKRRLKRADVPDERWPTDNEWGIPTLDIAMQGTTADAASFVRWSSIARGRRIEGTYHFYTQDEKFATVWSDPHRVVNSGCGAVVEVNYSTFRGLPRAVALYDIYRKRWLARYWQSRGLRVFVDLNVEPEFRTLNLLGVPRGWSAYATRSHRKMGPAAIERDHEAAVAHAAGNELAFVVYGGGRAVRSLCERRGWAWIKEDIDRARGR